VTAGQPWEAILRTARAAKCDAVVMASHGRGGLSGLILGSETTHVLAKSKVPVLVVR
jgi:nucleotide-binding universal stress UspA family protein